MVYTIGEMAKMLGVPASTLRYYDKEGLLPFVARSSGGIRQFLESDIEWLRVIGCMKKAAIRSRLWVLLLPAVSTRLITSSETSGVFHWNTSGSAAGCVFDWNTSGVSVRDICSKETAAGFSGSAAVWLFNK